LFHTLFSALSVFIEVVAGTALVGVATVSPPDLDLDLDLLRPPMVDGVNVELDVEDDEDDVSSFKSVYSPPYR
jgi:hypothetical protein